MTPHSTAAPVPGYTSYRRNVRCVHWLQQVARIRSLVHGLALQRMQEFLHLGTTLMHSGEKGVGVADRMALNESTVNYRWITEVTGAHSWQFFATMLQHITFSFLSCVCVCVLGDVNKVITFSTGRTVQSSADESRKPAIITASCVPEGYW